MALFAQSGTLAGVDVTVTPFASGSPATYTEVHNLNPGNTYTVLVGGATFTLPPGRKLVIDQPSGSVVLNGMGDYEVLASNGDSVMPRIESSANYSNVAAAGNPPDGITLEDTGVVWRIKDLGVATGKLSDDAVTADKLAPDAVTFSSVASGALTRIGTAGIVTADITGANVGDTVTLTYDGVAVTYEFTNGGAPGPGNISVDLPTVNVDFPAKINANQPDLGAYCVLQNLQVCVNTRTAILAGKTLTISKTGAGIHPENTISAQGEASCGIEHYRFTVSAVNTSGIILPLDGKVLRGAWVSETTPTGRILQSPTGFTNLAVSGSALALEPGGAIGNFMDVFLYVEYL